jgi:hypothetical protein
METPSVDLLCAEFGFECAGGRGMSRGRKRLTLSRTKGGARGIRDWIKSGAQTQGEEGFTRTKKKKKAEEITH